jgi:CMP-N-acetylneuraminic acid synthetase
MDYPKVASSLNRIALIPARGGSKGVLRKNLTKVAGKSLVEWAFFSAIESNLFSNICVSTDDVEIARHAESFGAEIYFMRPAELALDNTLQIDVINHAVAYFRTQGIEFDSLTLLQPTSPFRYPKDLVNAHSTWDSNQANSLISVLESSQYNISTMYQVGPEPITQGIALLPLIENGTSNKGTLRQGFKVQFWRNGAIYIFRIGNSGVGPLLLYEPIIGYEMPWYQSINIDTYQDLELAELIAPKFISGLR